jgi:anti-sigma regulatory factor (Ser/Thr protein kinase)
MRNALVTPQDSTRRAPGEHRGRAPGRAVWRIGERVALYQHDDGGVHARASRYIVGDGSESPPAAWAMPFTYTTDLSEVRALVRWHARRAGLPEPRARDLVIAVSEVAANTVRHAQSPGTLEIWHDEEEIVCEIHDQGVIADPLAGQRRPAADAVAGHGLWLVHRLCDLVELLSGEDGTTVRMHMAIRGANAAG